MRDSVSHFAGEKRAWWTVLLKHHTKNEKKCVFLQTQKIEITNPPFSLFREYVAQLVKYNKKFLIIGNGNSITYRDIFKFIKENNLWLGVTKPQTFLIDNKENFAKYCSDKNKVTFAGKDFWAVNISVGTPTYWFTNLEHNKRHEEIILYKEYNSVEYPKYDNYDAIEVSKVADIPIDYCGFMGVPITFLDKYNPEQFEIIGLANDKREKDDAFIQATPFNLDAQHKNFVGFVVNGKATYARIVIKNKKI